MPTIGLLSGMFPAEPKNPMVPKVKMPPLEATSQYPPASAVTAMPTIGWLRCMLPIEP
jgi:hypothetical protein